jgi:D-alanine-D-alanine ligase
VYCLKSIADLEKLSDKLSAYFFKKNWMLERRISGREFSVGILNNQALPIVEIKPKDEYYSYDAKYFSDQTEYICPANLSEEDTKNMQLLAKRAFKAINCEHWGRVDFMMDDFGVYLLEVNTVPGLTPSSLVPKAASSIGIEFDDLILKLLELERVTC